MIVYASYPVADSANLLAGTDLQTAPGPGIMKFYCCSDQIDTLWSIFVPNQPVVARNIPCAHRATANITNDLSVDVPYILAVNGGEQIVVSVDETTAMAAAFTAIFIPAAEMGR
jgi:hypothetical protein